MQIHQTTPLRAFCLAIALFPSLCSASDEDNLFSLELEALLNVQVVTPGKKAQSLSDVSQTVYVVEASEIAERSYRNIMEALDGLPGIHLQKNWYLDRLVVRGQVLTLDKLLLLVDGQAMTMKSDNYNILNGAAPLAMQDIARIEVLMGPSSTLYGSGAFVGVINIKTTNAEPGLALRANVSSANERGVGLSYGTQLGNTRLSLSGSYQDSNGDRLALSFPDGVPPAYDATSVVADGYNTLNAKRLAAKLESQNLMIRAQYSDAELGWPTAIFETDINDHDNTYTIRHTSVQAQYYTSLSEHLSHRLRAYLNDATGYWRGVYGGELYLAPDGEIYGGKYYGAEYRLDYHPAGNLSLVGGVEYTRNLDVRSVDYTDEFENSSLFAMLDYQMTEALGLELGARVEKYSYRKSAEVMPQFGLVYRPQETSTLKFTYGEGFIAPSTWVRELQQRTGQTSVAPELYQAYEISYQHAFASWVNTLSAFYSTQSDNIQVAYDINTPIDVYNSPSQEHYKGLEWSANMLFSESHSLKLNLSYIDTQEDSADGQTRTLPGVSKHMASLAWRTRLDDHQVMTLAYKFAATPEGYPHLAATHRIDLSWHGTDFYGLEASFKIGNLLNKRIETYARSSRAESIPDRGRHIAASLTWRF